MDIQTKDGITLRGIPDDTPEEEVRARIEQIRANRSSYQQTPPAPIEEESQPIPTPAPKADESLVDAYARWMEEGAKGVVSGAADIGNTLINASTFIPRKISSAAGSDAFENWNKEREASLKDWQKSNKSTPFDIGSIVGQIAGTSGVGNVLKVPAIAANMPRLAQALETGGMQALDKGSAVQNALLRLAAGGAVGGASAGMINPEDAATGAAMGAGMVGIGGPVLKGAAIGAGKISDLITGRTPSVQAGRIARDIAGDELAAIRAANELADPSLTSSQAAANVPRYEWANLGERARASSPTEYGLKFEAQEAKRLADLDSVMPDLKAAVDRRAAVTAPMYDEAMNSTKQVNANPVMKLIDKFIDENPKLDAVTAPLSKIKSDLYATSGQGLETNVRSLSSLSQNIKKMIEGKNPDGSPQFDVKALTKIKETLDNQIGVAEPKYAAARTKFKEMSAPVNQAQLIQAMKDTLVNSKGGERVTPFLNAMGAGEKSLFRKADQSPRFGSLDEVLTPKQRAVKDSIVKQLKRDAAVEQRSRESSQKVTQLMRDDSISANMPAFVDKWFSAAKRGIDVAETHINKKTMEKIAEGMKSGKSANEMLDVLPAEERNKILNGIIRMQRGGVVAAGSGAMVED